MNIFRLVTLSVVICAFFFPAGLTAQESLVLYNVDTTDFPVFGANLFLYNADGSIRTDLDIKDFRGFEDGIETEVLELICPPKGTGEAESLGVVLTLDVSSSMSAPASIEKTKIDVVKEAAIHLVRHLPLGKVQCAITAFFGSSEIVHPFSTDTASLIRAIEELTARDAGSIQNGTDYNAALTASRTGAINVATRVPPVRTIFFLTDSEGEADEEVIIDSALGNDVRIHTIVVGQPTSDFLKELSDTTGGLWFENVTDGTELANIFLAVSQVSLGRSPCYITWRTRPGCSFRRTFELLHVPSGQKGKLTYFYRRLSQPRLALTPHTLRFGPVTPGSSAELPVLLYSLGDTVTIQEVQGVTPEFTIPELQADASLFPLTLAAGDTLRLTLRFTPENEGPYHTSLRFLTNDCNDPFVYCFGGWNSPESIQSDLRLTHPNGGERFRAGIDTVMRWEGIAPQEPVRLEYSTDAGATWTIATDRTTLPLQQPWLVPNSPSTTCLARVTALRSGDIRSSLLHDRTVIDARFTPDGKQLAVLTNLGTIFLWDLTSDSLIGRMQGPPSSAQMEISPDGRLIAVGGRGEKLEVVVWHVESRSYLDLIPYGYNRTPGKSLLSFTPDATRLVMMLNNQQETIPASNTLMIYNIARKEVERQVTDSRQFYRHGGFSPDGRYFAVGGEQGIIQIWNSTIDTLLREFVDSTGTVRELRFNYNSRSLYSYTSSDSGHRLTEWNVNDGTVITRLALSKPLYDFDPGIVDMVLTDGNPVLFSPDSGTFSGEFPGHTDKVFTSRFSPDGSLLATGGNDFHVRLWEVKRGEHPADISDSLWAIIAPDLQLLDIDFDSVAVTSRKDSVILGYLVNRGTADAEISLMGLQGENNTDFRITRGGAPFVLAAGDSREVELQFAPMDTGPRSAEMIITTASDRLKAPLRGVGVFSDLIGDTIDFGQNAVGTVHDSIGFALHRGNNLLRIDSVRLAGPHPQQFEFSPPAIPLTLAKGNRLELPVRFAPATAGLWEGHVEIFHSGFGSPGRIVLRGEGIRVNLPMISTPDTIHLPARQCTSEEVLLHVPVHNAGNAPLELDRIVLEGKHAGDFTLVQPSVKTISPGTTLQIELQFSPGDTGERSALLRITSNARNHPEVVVALSGRLETVGLDLGDKEIDLGEICPGNAIGIFYRLKNNGSLPTTIHLNALITEGEGEITLPDPFDLSSGSEATGEAMLAPAVTEGRISGSIIFTDTICGTSQVLSFRCIVNSPEVTIDPIPPVCAEEPVRLTAHGASRYEWEPALDVDCLGNPDCPHPVIRPTTSRTYVVRGYNDRGCFDTASIRVVVREEPTVLTLRMGREHRARPGDSVRLPIIVEPSIPEPGNVTDLEIELEYDPNILFLDVNALHNGLQGTRLAGWNIVSFNESQGRLFARMESATGIGSDPLLPLLQLEGRIFLANVTGTEVRGTIRSGSSCVAFSPFAGYVTVDSICGLHQRLIEVARAKYSLSPPYPNPATGDRLTIDFSLGLDGPTTVELINSADGRSALLLNDHLEPGAYRLTWRTENQPSGTYLVRVSSGDWNRVEWVRIVR